TALVLVIANAFDLGAIASVGSAVSLTAFLLVGLAGWRRRRDTGSNPVLIIASLTSIAAVLGFFFVDTLRNDPPTFWAILCIGLLAVVLDAVFRKPVNQLPLAKETST